MNDIRRFNLLGTICMFFLSLSLIVLTPTYAKDDSNIEEITNAITKICSRPSDAGKYWDVAISGDGNAKIKLLLAKGGVTGKVNFSKGEWEGTKTTIENSKDYRECVKSLAPLFVNKFSSLSGDSNGKKKSRRLGGLSWVDEHNGVSAELKKCKKMGSDMICYFVFEALNIDKHLELDCRYRYCPSYDQDGNEFIPKKLTVANKSSNNLLGFSLIQGVPTKAQIRFVVFPTSTAISKVSLNMGGKFQFKNMSITGASE